MRIRRHAQGKFYTIECPEGTGVVRRSEDVPHDLLLVPFKGQELRIPSDPPELLPLLAETGNFGVMLVGEPEPDVRLDGASCHECGEADVAWLQLGDASESVRCDRCGSEFDVAVPAKIPGSISRRVGVDTSGS